MMISRWLVPLALLSVSFWWGLEDSSNDGPVPFKPRGVPDNDWFMSQRTYPFADIEPMSYYHAVRETRARVGRTNRLSVLPWTLTGPSNIGGRISSLALHPTDQNILYAGAAGGGVWKSTDGAASWNNVFSEASSIGSLHLDPTDPATIYVGTGEGNPAGVATYPGNGIWKSTDEGNSWTLLGLENTGALGRLAIHPAMPSRVFAAALGRYRSRTEERGIYRSTDAGISWERVLFVNDTTGACDVVIDPSNPDRILAATWTRYRPITYSVIAGTGSGLWVSTDGGTTWTQITGGFPFNDVNLGRTSLTTCPSQPEIFYALTTSGVSPRGIYKSTTSGDSWTLVSGSSPFGGEGQVWYNNVIAAKPTDANLLLTGMTDMYRSTNGGVAWSSTLGSMHVDHHAIEFFAGDPARVVVGNDGGVFVSSNSGASWIKSYNLPVTQFYAGTIDFSNPSRYFGGTQDNGTLRTLTGSVDDWSDIYGGDGFYVLVDPTNPNRIYAESQWGGLGYSTNGGSTFLNGQTAGFGTNDRTNWNTPIAMDLTNPLTLYVGTYRVFKTVNGMLSWTAISSDLTRGLNGRIGTITTIDVARSNPSVLYVGTDDAKVSVTQDAGLTWTDVTGILPNRWVTRVSIDPEAANIAYVTQSGYLEDEYGAHIHKTTDYGQTWTSVGGDLPDIPVNDIIIDSGTLNLYAATDAGVMYTTNGGINWLVLGEGMPEVPVHDLTFHEPTRTLLASTHGRSSFLIDLTTLVSVETATNLIPSAFFLAQNHPNPFNPETKIEFSVPEDGHVTLTVFDLRGREVARLVDGNLTAGVHTSRWSAAESRTAGRQLNPSGRLASGVYIYHLAAGTQSATRKMILLR